MGPDTPNFEVRISYEFHRLTNNRAESIMMTAIEFAIPPSTVADCVGERDFWMENHSFLITNTMWDQWEQVRLSFFRSSQQ